MIGKIYKTIDIPGSNFLRNGVLRVSRVEDDTVEYKYITVEGVPHSKRGNEYAQGISHFKKYTIELTELEKALV